jgi:hypothetical protein
MELISTWEKAFFLNFFVDIFHFLLFLAT